MTEELNVSSDVGQQGGETQVQQHTEQAGDVSQKNDAPPAPEKYLNQYQVNDLIRNAKKEEADKVRREYESKMSSAQNQNQSNMQQNSGSLGGMRNLNEDQIRDWVRQESQRLAQETAHQEAASKVAREFLGKLSEGANKYSDFDSKMGRINVINAPELVQLSNEYENTADIWYELSSNPLKFAAFKSLAKDDPIAAREAMSELASSIKNNSNAGQIKKAPEPLSQIKPLTIGTDNGAMTVRDFKKADWLRG